jgi:hypothetical protein
MVTRVDEHCAGFRNGFAGRRDDVQFQLVSPRKPWLRAEGLRV